MPANQSRLRLSLRVTPEIDTSPWFSVASSSWWRQPSLSPAAIASLFSAMDFSRTPGISLAGKASPRGEFDLSPLECSHMGLLSSVRTR